jgi:hypothetical protein
MTFIMINVEMCISIIFHYDNTKLAIKNFIGSEYHPYATVTIT